MALCAIDLNVFNSKGRRLDAIDDALRTQIINEEQGVFSVDVCLIFDDLGGVFLCDSPVFFTASSPDILINDVFRRTVIYMGTLRKFELENS